MADFFISPKEKTELHLDATRFAEEVTRSWPGASYEFVEEGKGPYGVRWTVPMQRGQLEGALNRAGQCIVLDADVFDAAAFARWVRRQVPDEFPLYFYDEGYSADVALTENTSVEDLARPFLAKR